MIHPMNNMHRTPKGKQISTRRYLALTAAQQARSQAYGCAIGHLDCAAWEAGPCSVELHGTDADEIDTTPAPTATCPECSGSDTVSVSLKRRSFVCRPCNLYFEASK